MSEQGWAPPARAGRRIDWGAPSAAAGTAREIPDWALPAPAEVPSGDGDGLDDLFVEDAVDQGTVAEEAPAPDEALTGDDLGLDDLFAEDTTAEDTGAGETAAPAEPAPMAVGDDLGLDDLFAEDAPVGGTGTEGGTDALDDLFADAPATPADDLGLDDLFADDAPAPAGPGAEVGTEDAPSSETVDAPVEEPPAPPGLLAGGWASPPAAVTKTGGLAATRREGARRALRKAEAAQDRPRPTVEVPERFDAPTTVVINPAARAAAEERAAAEAADTTPSDAAPVEAQGGEVSSGTEVETAAAASPAEDERDAAPQEVAEVPAPEAAPQEVTEAPQEVEEVAEAPAPEAAPQEVTEAPQEVEEVAEVSQAAPQEADVVAETPEAAATPAPEGAAPREVAPTAPAAVPAQAAPPVDPVRKRFNLEERRRQAEAASMGGTLGREQAILHAQMAQAYALPEHLWGYADRILGFIANDPAVQASVNHFQLTRDSLLDNDQRRRLQEVVAPRLIDANVAIHNPHEVQAVFDMVYDELVGISVLGRLWRDKTITEIMVDAWDKVAIERGGTIVRTPIRFRDLTHAQRVARDLAAKVSDRSLSPVNPLVTAQLPGARITFAYGAVVKSGISISLRKFVDLLGIEKLLEFGAIDDEMVQFLRECVLGRATIIVSGGTGTGKTTQINALSSFIPDSERVITIEDAFELQLSNQNVLSLQTKEKASADDTVTVNQADLMTNTLRMRPDRVIVGEIREGQGALVMLRAASTGHDGTMTTIHANSTSAALNERLADLVREASGMPDDVAKRSVAGAVHLVVQVTRKRGRRFISEIAVVDRSCYRDGAIVPEPVFVGDLDMAGTPIFRHVGGVRPDTELGVKLAEAGFDTSHWEPTT